MSFRDAVRTFVLDLIGVLCILAAFAWAARDGWSDGELALTTSFGALTLATFGAWLIDRTILERFIAWLVVQAKSIGSILKAVKGGGDAPS